MRKKKRYPPINQIYGYTDGPDGDREDWSERGDLINGDLMCVLTFVLPIIVPIIFIIASIWLSI